jgi:predicted RNA-binding protein (virulence factor B family)
MKQQIEVGDRVSRTGFPKKKYRITATHPCSDYTQTEHVWANLEDERTGARCSERLDRLEVLK